MATRERLKLWRHELGLTQPQFCDMTGIPLRTLRGYEGGTRRPGEEALAAIASTGCNINWLLTGEGQMISGARENVAEYQVDSASLDALAGRHARRWAKIIELVESASTPEEAETILDEIFARARQQAELAELRRTVKDLTDAIKKRA